MYRIGDKVAYPMHGAGVIESIEEKEIMGNTGQYYVLRFIVGNMKVMVPVNNVEDVGLREIIPHEQYASVLEFLKAQEDDASTNWNRRYRENLEKMKSGDIFGIADVVRSLASRDKEKGLSTGERKMLNKAKQILMSELVLASGSQEDEVKDLVECIL